MREKPRTKKEYHENTGYHSHNREELWIPW